MANVYKYNITTYGKTLTITVEQEFLDFVTNVLGLALSAVSVGVCFKATANDYASTNISGYSGIGNLSQASNQLSTTSLNTAKPYCYPTVSLKCAWSKQQAIDNNIYSITDGGTKFKDIARYEETGNRIFALPFNFVSRDTVNIVLGAEVAQQINKATFQNTLINATLTNEQTEYEANNNYVTDIKSVGNYYFSLPPKIIYYLGGVAQEKFFEKKDDFTYHLEFNENVDNNSLIKIDNSGTTSEVFANVVGDLSKGVYWISDISSIKESQLPYLFIFNYPENSEIEIATLSYYGRDGAIHTVDGIIDISELLVKITLPIENGLLPNSTVTLTVHLKKNERDISYHLSNCSGVSIPQKYEIGNVLDISVKADENFKFYSEPTLTYVLNGNLETVQGFIDSDIARIQTTIDNIDLATNIEVYATALPKESDIDKLYNGTVSVYEVTKENLEAFAASRFTVVSSDYYYNEYDLGDYVSSLKRFFTPIDTAGETTMKLGNAVVSTIVKSLSNAINNVSLGVRKIKRIYNTQNDFTDIDIFAILPYCGKVSLDNSVMNRNVEIVYRVNVVTGDCKILFYDYDTKEVLQETGGNVSIDIPYRKQDSNNRYVDTINNDYEGISLLNDIEPKIFLRAKKQTTTIKANTNERKKIRDLSGFVKFKSCEIETILCYSQEYDLIRNALLQGVII